VLLPCAPVPLTSPVVLSPRAEWNRLGYGNNAIHEVPVRIARSMLAPKCLGVISRRSFHRMARGDSGRCCGYAR
jgi:hypothetical protein